jgi:hypothetical protein
MESCICGVTVQIDMWRHILTTFMLTVFSMWQYPILSDEKGDARKAYGVSRGLFGLTASSKCEDVRVGFALC